LGTNRAHPPRHGSGGEVPTGRQSTVEGDSPPEVAKGSPPNADESRGVLRVSEVFSSIQGEGLSAGLPAVFVRLQGCAVGCVWCDTKYSWKRSGGQSVPLAALLEIVDGHHLDNVVVTGGEPLEHRGFVSLVAGLKAHGKHVEVETAGTKVPPNTPVDQWNVSLKLAHSGVAKRRRLRAAAIAAFRDLGAWFKFVVAHEGAVEEVLALQKQYQLPSGRIMLMPLGTRAEDQYSRMPVVADWCRRYGFRFSPRLQILIWGPERGT